MDWRAVNLSGLQITFDISRTLCQFSLLSCPVFLFPVILELELGMRNLGQGRGTHIKLQ